MQLQPSHPSPQKKKKKKNISHGMNEVQYGSRESLLLFYNVAASLYCF